MFWLHSSPGGQIEEDSASLQVAETWVLKAQWVLRDEHSSGHSVRAQRMVKHSNYVDVLIDVPLLMSFGGHIGFGKGLESHDFVQSECWLILNYTDYFQMCAPDMKNKTTNYSFRS